MYPNAGGPGVDEWRMIECVEGKRTWKLADTIVESLGLDGMSGEESGACEEGSEEEEERGGH